MGGGRGGHAGAGGLMSKLMWCGKRSLIFPADSSSESVAEGYVRVAVVGNVENEEEVVVLEVETNYLNHPLFEKLLNLTGEEYGYSYEGALRIACDHHLFRYLIHLLDTRNPCVHYMDLPDLISKFSNTTTAQ